MESIPIAPRTNTPVVSQARETGERKDGRRRFDEERRKALRGSRTDAGARPSIAELDLSPSARQRQDHREELGARETEAEDSVHEVRGRRLDIRI